MEALRLRVKDVDLVYDPIMVRDGKGTKDRVTMPSATLKAELMEHLKTVKLLPEADLRAGYGRVYLPHALKTIMIDTHVLNGGGRGVRSPIDLL